MSGHFTRIPLLNLFCLSICLCLPAFPVAPVPYVEGFTRSVVTSEMNTNYQLPNSGETGHPAPVMPDFASASQNPRWKILVLIYKTTDFTYSDNAGQHHAVATMTASEVDRAVAAANTFANTDIPALTSGNMIPLLTIRQPNHPLASLSVECGYWPDRPDISADLDPAFDSVIVIWDDTGTDLITGQPADLNGCGGLAVSNGTGQTHSTFPIDSVASNDRNVFKHEWGHSILFYYEAAGLSPKPTVDNHINSTTTRYVHCPSGTAYILQDETDDNPIPNSIYNNTSGFTHDYYSGTTAKPENPGQCLGITPTAWSYGGPVTKPVVNTPSLLMNGGFEEGTPGPSWWRTEAWTQAYSTFTWDISKVHSGSRSIKIVNSQSNDARWIQTVSVQSNSIYLLSGWVKTQGVAHTPEAGDAGANLSIMGGFEYTNGLFGDADWTYVSMIFNTGARTQIDVAARLGMYSGTTTGTAWFDDLKLQLLSAPICYTLTKTSSPAGSGSIAADPAPNCSNGTKYIHGTVVKLTANPSADYRLGQWSGDASGYANPSYVVMTAGKSVTANFVQNDKDSVGVFRPSNGVIFLKNANISGFADVALNYGLGGDYPVVGDWDGDGVDTIGVYRGNTFLLRNSNTVGFADLNFTFGQAGDQPIAGDWDGDGDDTIGVYRPSTGQFLLRNSNTTGGADVSFFLGNAGDVGIAGDWNGDGTDTVGVFRPSNGVIFLKNTNTSGFAEVALNYGLGGDKPVVGDWDNNGTTTIGVYRGNKFLLRNSNTNGFANITFDLGILGDIPIAGNWDGKP